MVNWIQMVVAHKVVKKKYICASCSFRDIYESDVLAKFMIIHK